MFVPSSSSPLNPRLKCIDMGWTITTQDRHLPKQEVLKINLAEACDQIVAGSTREPAEAEEEEEEEEESTEEEEPGKRKRKQKPARKPAAKKRRKGEEGEPERIVLGLRLSANLLLGVARWIFSLALMVDICGC